MWAALPTSLQPLDTSSDYDTPGPYLGHWLTVGMVSQLRSPLPPEALWSLSIFTLLILPDCELLKGRNQVSGPNTESGTLSELNLSHMTNDL